MSAPAVPPGYRLERPTLADADVVADLIDTVTLDLVGRRRTSPEDVLAAWNGPTVNFEEDVWIVREEASGDVVATLGCWNDPPYMRPASEGSVHPDHRGRGLGTLLLALAEARAMAQIDRAAPDLQVSHDHDLNDKDTAGAALLIAHGYAPARTFYAMVRPLRDVELDLPVLPDGILLRDFDPQEDPRAVYDAEKEAFREHWGEIRDTFEMFKHRYFESSYYDPSLWVVAVGGDTVVGSSIVDRGSPEDADLAWVSSFSVLKRWRRRGIARALLWDTFARAKAAGATRIGLGVDAENAEGALSVYESVGLAPYESETVYSKVLREGRQLRPEEA